MKKTCGEKYVLVSYLGRMISLFLYGHSQHTCRYSPKNPRDFWGYHKCSCGFRWRW